MGGAMTPKQTARTQWKAGVGLADAAYLKDFV